MFSVRFVCEAILVIYKAYDLGQSYHEVGSVTPKPDSISQGPKLYNCERFS